MTASGPIGEVLREGSHGTIFASDLMVALALEAAQQLAERGTEATVVNMSSIKPLDEDLIVRHARRAGIVVTAENHSVIGDWTPRWPT
ncbi:transketolase C-terminal domain/subunit [Nitrobacteraceae bacterium AZCC 2161]